MTAQVVRSRSEFLTARAAIPTGHRVGAVLTMGALHAGHQALLRAARLDSDTVVATVFVNPAQFGPGEDLTRYPRTPDADLRVATDAGVDLIWMPSPADVYPAPTTVAIDPGPLGREMEGAVRPGHFAGVLTVVAKFLHLIRPAAALFGEKDYQQLTLVRAMVRDLDLDLDVEVVGVPTVRDSSGLARSSRNAYLSSDEHRRALAVPAALDAGRAAAAAGADATRAAARAVLAAADGIDVDYLQVRGPQLQPDPSPGPARLLVAARVGATRLIDNVAVELGR